MLDLRLFLRVRSISAPFNALRTVELVLESDPIYGGLEEALMTLRVPARSGIHEGDVYAVRMVAIGPAR